MNTVRGLLDAAVRAKEALWDSITALEKHLADGDDVTDKQADLITEWVENCAGGGGISAADARRFLSAFRKLA